MVREVPEMAAHTEQAVQATRTAKLVIKCNMTHSYKECPAFGKNATNAVLKIISVLAADQLKAMAKAKDAGEVERQLTARVQKDATEPTEVDAPGEGHIQEVDHRQATPTA